MEVSFHTFGAFGSVIMIAALFRLFSFHRSKQRKYVSKQRANFGIFIVLGLVLIGYAVYTAYRPEDDTVPMLFDTPINDLFGVFAPMFLIILNPLFSAGVYVVGLVVNEYLISGKLDREGILTIPSGFQLKSLTRDDEGRKRWELSYQYGDGYFGCMRFKDVIYQEWAHIITIVSDPNLQPEQIGHFFLVQYLPNGPGNHRLWRSDTFTQEALQTSRKAMMNHPQEMALFEKIFANIEKGEIPVPDGVEPAAENEIPVIEIKIGDGKVQAIVIKVVFWTFVVGFALFAAYVMGWLDFLRN